MKKLYIVSRYVVTFLLLVFLVLFLIGLVLLSQEPSVAQAPDWVELWGRNV